MEIFNDNFDPFNENMNDNIRAIYNQTKEYCLENSSSNIEFNTGKPYCKSGQVIRAYLLNSGDVFFQDLARGIEGILYSRSIAFNPETIELEYLNGRYKDSSLFQVKQIIESFERSIQIKPELDFPQIARDATAAAARNIPGYTFTGALPEAIKAGYLTVATGKNFFISIFIDQLPLIKIDNDNVILENPENLTDQEKDVLRILTRLFSQSPDKGNSKWFINRWFPVITYGDVCGLSPADRAIIADYYNSTHQQDK